MFVVNILQYCGVTSKSATPFVLAVFTKEAAPQVAQAKLDTFCRRMPSSFSCSIISTIREYFVWNSSIVFSPVYLIIGLIHPIIFVSMSFIVD